MSKILRVRQGGSQFYVLAEKTFVLSDRTFIDYPTQKNFPPKELSYAITKLKDGKPKTFIGYIESTESQICCKLRVPVIAKPHSSYMSQFRSERIQILETIYTFDSN